MQQSEITETAPSKKDAIHQIKGLLSPLHNPRWISFGVYGVLLTIGVILGTLAWNWSDLQTNPSEQTKKKFDASLSVVSTGAAIAGGLVVFLNFRVAQKKLDQETEKAKTDAKLAESRLKVDRFSKAVELLGKNDSIHLRLGGIYALESIADDSNPDAPDEDYRQVLEVLTAFVRENSPYLPNEQGEKEPIAQTQATEQQAEPGEEMPKEPPSVSTDIQAVLTVLNRRKHRDKDWGKYPIDLNRADLRSAYLEEASLQNANLNGTNFMWARLFYANLQGAELQEANLQTFLWGANLQHAKLWRANLQHANLWRANLQDAGLVRAQLQNAVLFDVNFQYANLEEANLKGAELEGTNLYKAKLANANLRGARFWDYTLTGDELAEAKEKAKANIKSALGWASAHYDPEIREWLGLPPETVQSKES